MKKKKIKITPDFSITKAIIQARQGAVLSHKARRQLIKFYIAKLVELYVYQYNQDHIALISYLFEYGYFGVKNLNDADLLITIYGFHRDDTHANNEIKAIALNLKDSLVSRNSQ